MASWVYLALIERKINTFMKIIVTISKPTDGRITLDGVDITKEPNKIRKILGYLQQDFGVYPNLNAYEFLEYIVATCHHLYNTNACYYLPGTFCRIYV